MANKQNAADFAHEYPLATKTVNEAFYVDDCLTGADSVEEGIELCRQLQALFAKADFLLRKWNSSSPGPVSYPLSSLSCVVLLSFPVLSFPIASL